MPNYYIEAYRTIPADYISYAEMVQYVEAHCVPSGVVTVSGITYEEMVEYFNTHVPTGSGIISYEDMAQYVAEHCTFSGTTGSGITYEEMVDYVWEYCVTNSGITYGEMVEYVSTHAPTGSGNLCLDGAELTLTFPDTLIQSSFFPVVTKTVVSGVIVQVTKGCVPAGSGITYAEMADYVTEQLSGFYTTFAGEGGINVTTSGNNIVIDGTQLSDNLYNTLIAEVNQMFTSISGVGDVIVTRSGGVTYIEDEDLYVGGDIDGGTF